MVATDAGASQTEAAQPPTSGASAKAESGYEVRWDEAQKLFRVWNPVLNAWASRPGFSDQRIAQVVADSLGTPAQVRRAQK